MTVLSVATILTKIELYFQNGEVSNNTPPLLSLWMESKLVNNTNSHIPGQCVGRERKNHRYCFHQCCPH